MFLLHDVLEVVRLLEELFVLLLGIFVILLHIGWEQWIALQRVWMVTYLHLLTLTEEVMAAVLVGWHLVDLFEGVDLLFLLFRQDALGYWGSDYWVTIRVHIVRYVCILFV